MLVSDENRFVTIFLIISILLLFQACMYKEPTDRITRSAVDVCGCNRICVLRMCQAKGSPSINESEYRKHCN